MSTIVCSLLTSVTEQISASLFGVNGWYRIAPSSVQPIKIKTTLLRQMMNPIVKADPGAIKIRIRKHLGESSLSSLCQARPWRYLWVMQLKVSDTDPKQTSGLKRLRVGSGQGDVFLLYFFLLESSSEFHCCRSWKTANMSDWIRTEYTNDFEYNLLDAQHQFGHACQALNFGFPVLIWATSSWKRGGRPLIQNKAG